MGPDLDTLATALFAKAHLGPWFPYVPNREGFNKRLRRAGETISHVIAALERECPCWDDDVWLVDSTPDGAVVSASVALTACDLARDDSGGVRSYLVFCDRSFGQYLFDVLIDAGSEFGVTVRAG